MQFEHDDAVRSILRRARVLKTDDSGSQQKVDLAALSKEKPEKIVRVLDFGFNSYIPQDGEGILLQLGSRSDRSLFFGGEHQKYRQKNLQEGQSVLYDSEGNVIFAKTGSGISVNAKKGQVEIHAQNDLVAVISDKGDIYLKPANDKIVYLGGNGHDGSYDFVLTNSGPSINVKARIS